MGYLFCIIAFLFNFNGARYLIITPDEYQPILKELANWKNEKGIKSYIATLSQTGWTLDSIKNYIINAYNNWPIKPEYILLCGSPNFIPSYNNRYDDYYGDVTGNYLIEIPVGRLPFRNFSQCSTMIRKILAYEKGEIFSEDTNFILKLTTIVREDQPPDPYYQADARYIRNLVLENGFILAESLLNLSGHNANNVINSMNDGRAFLVYRGQGVGNWWSPFNINVSLANNLNKLPIVLSATCQTMALGVNESMLGEAFMRFGKPCSLKGAVAFLGTTLSGSGISQYRGTYTRAFFNTLFNDKIYKLGLIHKRAKYVLDSIFRDQTRYQEWNLYGCPEMAIWTKKPRKLIVECDTIVNLAPQQYVIRIKDSLTQMPISNVFVCLTMDSTIYLFDSTDNSGYVRFNFSPFQLGNFKVVAHYYNYFPKIKTGRVIPGNIPYFQYYGITINDYPNGNNDNQINPGEEIWGYLKIKNIGQSPAYNVRGILRSQVANILDSILNFRDILPNDTSSAYYRFSTPQNCTAYQQLPFTLILRDTFNNQWQINFSLTIFAGKIKIISFFINDSSPFGNNNQQLGRNEGIKLIPKIKNIGNSFLKNIGLKILPIGITQNYINIIDSLIHISFINPNETIFNPKRYFTLNSSPTLPANYPFAFKLYIRGFGETYQIFDSFNFNLVSENLGNTEPIGPDNYGYYAYDEIDTLTGQAPVYQWREISQIGRLIPEISNHDAAVITLPLPFSFKYYGIWYDSISISSNGFLAMGRTDYRFGNNGPIPDTSGPPAMIAPFWDDLNTNESLNNGYGSIYEYYDQENNIYIVEFYQTAHHRRPNVRETFQVIFYDPRYYPTPTGDGEIVFQYYLVADPTSLTLGIENQLENDGLQYLYNSNYHPNAFLLTSRRAIKFTTKRPINKKPYLTIINIFTSDSLGNNNGILEPNERILLNFQIKNLGETTAFNTFGIVRNLDNNVIIIDSIKNLGNIPVGSIISNPSPFIFDIIFQPNDSILDFYLSLNCNNYSVNIPFSLSIGYQSEIKEKFSTIIKKISQLKFDQKKFLILNPLGQRIKKEKLKKGIYYLLIKENKKWLKRKFIYLP
ncbi:MAG: C25 family cysteine peptidase [candidate division WOR-3 bacterium]|nr:C25 family cysteine peptidase [candidate division WOR-3 bacterium]